MSRRRKLEKFAALRSFDNVFENFDFEDDRLIWKEGEKPLKMSGLWRDRIFKNDGELVLELACGYGEYTYAMAQYHVLKNFIGIDVKGNRIYQGARKALDHGIINAAFIRARIENIDNFFEEKEVDEIWITFPDPFLKKSKKNRRLTAPHFLDRYRTILKSGGSVFLKTDSLEIFDFTREVLSNYDGASILYISNDIHSDGSLELYPELSIQTRYEKIHSELGKKINFLQFRL